MKIKKSDESILNVIKKIAIPILSYGSHEHWLYKKEVSNDKIMNRLQSMPTLLLKLAEHYFYNRNLGADDSFCSIMFFTSKEFETHLDAVRQIFNKVSACPVQISLREDGMWKIQVQHISCVGQKILEQLRENSLLPPELIQLYMDTQYAVDYMEEALFLITEDDAINDESCPSAFVKSLFENDFFRSIDISGMTLQQCTESELVRYIVSNKEKVYVYVDSCDEIFGKQLLWI